MTCRDTRLALVLTLLWTIHCAGEDRSGTPRPGDGNTAPPVVEPDDGEGPTTPDTPKIDDEPSIPDDDPVTPDTDTEPEPEPEPEPVPAPGGVTSPLPVFVRDTVSRQAGAAYMLPADLDDDGISEFLLTSLVEGIDMSRIASGVPISGGGAYVLRRDSSTPDGEIGEWETERVFNRDADIFFPNHSALFDVNNDGVDDWVIGAGFIPAPMGKLVWCEGSRAGGELSFGEPQELDVPDTDFWYHVAVPVDMDGDGDLDFVTSNHQGVVGSDRSKVEWYENMGLRGHASFTPHEIVQGGGAMVELHDLDGDGDLDILVPQFFHGESLLWLEKTGPDGHSWKRHVINDTTGRGFLTHVADVDGDGRLDIVFGNHNHQNATDPEVQVMGMYWFEIPPAATIRQLANWDDYMHVIYEGFNVRRPNADQNGAPGMFNVGDIEGDGDLDVAVSGDGDDGLYLLIQQEDGFELMVLASGREARVAGQQQFADLDQDGDLDLIWAVYGEGMMKLPDSNIYAFLQQ
jgi:hypothetical protein